MPYFQEGLLLGGLASRRAYFLGGGLLPGGLTSWRAYFQEALLPEGPTMPYLQEGLLPGGLTSRRAYFQEAYFLDGLLPLGLTSRRAYNALLPGGLTSRRAYFQEGLLPGGLTSRRAYFPVCGSIFLLALLQGSIHLTESAEENERIHKKQPDDSTTVCGDGSKTPTKACLSDGRWSSVDVRGGLPIFKCCCQLFQRT